MYGEWKEQYLDYNGLKMDLKKGTTRRPWNARDESEFTKKLERELEKIYNFQTAKVRLYAHVYTTFYLTIFRPKN
jgi:SPX domain protein involved in polyphosphate accumulation